MKYCSFATILVCFALAFCTKVFAYSTNDDSFHVRIAIVDVQFILENSMAVQSIRESVYRVHKKIQQDMSNKEAELKKIESTLIEKRSSIGEEKFEQEALKFEEMVNVTKKEIQKRKSLLESAHAEAMGKVHGTTIDIISDLAEKHNINLVIPSAQVLFAKSTLNMTLEVIEELNKQLKTVEVKYE